MTSRNPVERTLLRIDLRRGTSQRESIPREYVETFLGGRALAALFLYREVHAGKGHSGIMRNGWANTSI
jgi:aldehyde:ferredoxin oxidoreductase